MVGGVRLRQVALWTMSVSSLSAPTRWRASERSCDFVNSLWAIAQSSPAATGELSPWLSPRPPALFPGGSEPLQPGQIRFRLTLVTDRRSARAQRPHLRKRFRQGPMSRTNRGPGAGASGQASSPRPPRGSLSCSGFWTGFSCARNGSTNTQPSASRGLRRFCVLEARAISARRAAWASVRARLYVAQGADLHRCGDGGHSIDALSE